MASIGDITDWGTITEFDTDPTKVSAVETDFTFMLTEDNVPSGWLDADGDNPVSRDDLRLTSADDGTGWMNIDIRFITTNNNPALGELHVFGKLLTISSVVAVNFYGFANNPEASEAARGDANGGMEGTYKDSIRLAQNFDADPSGTPDQAIDSTQYNFDGFSEGSMVSGDLVDGKIGKAWRFEPLESQGVNMKSADLGITNNLTILQWLDLDAAASFVISVGKRIDGGAVPYLFGTSDTGTILLDATQLTPGAHRVQSYSDGSHCWAGTIDTSDGYYTYFDNAQSSKTAVSAGSISESGARLILAGQSWPPLGILSTWPGLISLTWILDITATTDWLTTTYNSQNAPDTFIVPGAATNIALLIKKLLRGLQSGMRMGVR